ncbi:hypothetical protein ACLOJK_018135 [Asimina triloba]
MDADEDATPGGRQHRARGVGEDNGVIGIVGDFHDVVNGLLLMEGKEEEGTVLILDKVTDALIHGRAREVGGSLDDEHGGGAIGELDEVEGVDECAWWCGCRQGCGAPHRCSIINEDDGDDCLELLPLKDIPYDLDDDGVDDKGAEDNVSGARNDNLEGGECLSEEKDDLYRAAGGNELGSD